MYRTYASYFYRCRPEDHLIAKCPQPPKENEKRRKQVCFNEIGNRACDNGKNNSDQNIYASMAYMSDNDECTSGKFGDSLQLTNWIIDYEATCHMAQDVQDVNPIADIVQMSAMGNS